jgi:hypothetical protein
LAAIPQDWRCKQVADEPALGSSGVGIIAPGGVAVDIEKAGGFFDLQSELETSSASELLPNFLYFIPVGEDRFDRVLSKTRYRKANVGTSVTSNVVHQTNGRSIVDVKFLELLMIVVGGFSELQVGIKRGRGRPAF